MEKSYLVERLAAFPALGALPRDELEWLAAHGRLEHLTAGSPVTRKGERLDHLFIVLSGQVTIHRDRGTGPRRVIDWQAGDVTGRLPYSRMGRSPDENILEVDTEVFALHEDFFEEMVCRCPAFTAHSVHLMLDRARRFNTSDLQEEKMISLGKLAAGLAHELNNPASATVRGAKLLLNGLTDADPAVRTLGEATLTQSQLRAIDRLRSACAESGLPPEHSPLEQTDREEEIADWLAARGADPRCAAALAETSLDIPDLEALAEELSGDVLAAAIRWIAGGCEIRALAVDIERAATRIYELVDSVKRFTYMDNLAGPEVVDVRSGLRDTLRIMSAKAKEKGVTVTLDFEAGLPGVQAKGGELNQVWLNLIDNALDAVPPSGHLDIDARREGDRVVVRFVDDGPGIDPEVLPRIFDAFFTTKEPGEGLGLGLEITRRLLRQYEGDISVESRPGRTEFRVGLMASPGTDPPASWA
jgi:signal transduction histidine kinase